MNEWIKHDGKGIPVPAETMVLVKLRDGHNEEKEGAPPSTAKFWEANWDHDLEDPYDIVAYKVVS